MGSSSISHDAKGNVTSDPTTGYTFGYSVENLLTTVNAPTWSRTLTYDPLLRLYQAAATQFLHDGEERIAEYAYGSQSNRYVHGPGADEPLVWYEGSGTADRRFLHADERGSIIAASDSAGNPLGISRYDEYGRNQNFVSRFVFAGQPYESVSQLNYARARMYNPRLGRFMQPDPIKYADGMNIYAYSKADPVNRKDPSGTGSICVSSNTAASRIRDACVSIDADGDGSFLDHDVRVGLSSSAQGGALYNFIVSNAGAVLGAGQAFGGACRGQYQCENTPTLSMARQLNALLNNATFMRAWEYAAHQAKRTGNEWGFTGRGRADFRLVGGFLEGSRNAISAEAIAQRVRMGADLFFHIHPNVGSRYSPWLSSGFSHPLYGGDLGVAYHNRILVGAHAFSNNKTYWFDGRDLSR